MIYYVMFPNGYDDVDGVLYTTMVLGEVSFKTFWVEQGFSSLENVVNRHTDMVELIKIKDEKGTEYSVEEFLNIVDKMKIVR